MRRLGEFILSGRIQALVVTSFLTMAGLMLPLLSYLAGGVAPALVTLRKGAVAGLQVIAGSLVLTAIVILLAGLNPQIVLAIAIGIWLPVWFCANVLRVTAAQDRLLLAAGMCSLIYILMTHLILGDVTAWWDGWLKAWVEQVIQEDRREQYREILAAAAPLMNAMTAAGLFISMVTTLLVARWWQAVLFNPGGFRQEFHALRLPRVLMLAVIAGLVLVFMDMAGPGTVVLDILLLLIFLYLFQGIAVIHRTVVSRKMARGWLFGMYLLLFVLPQSILFLACLGMVDSWLVRPVSGGGPNDKS
jgi:hypothetical protein